MALLDSVFALETGCLGTQAEGLGCSDNRLDLEVVLGEVSRIHSAAAVHCMAVAVLLGIAEEVDRSYPAAGRRSCATGHLGADLVADLRHNSEVAVPDNLRIGSCLDIAVLDVAVLDIAVLDIVGPDQDSQLRRVGFLRPVSELPVAHRTRSADLHSYHDDGDDDDDVT